MRSTAVLEWQFQQHLRPYGAARARARTDDFEFYTKTIDPPDSGTMVAGRAPFTAIQEHRGAAMCSVRARWPSTVCVSGNRTCSVRRASRAAMPPSSTQYSKRPPAELQKVAILDLNGTEDETLPPPTVDSNRRVMEPYAKRFRLGRIEGLTTISLRRTASRSSARCGSATSSRASSIDTRSVRRQPSDTAHAR